MKLWIDHCRNYSFNGDTPVNLGIYVYKHKNDNRKFKSWFGITATLYLFKWLVNITFVHDYDAYDKKINWYKYRKKG